jgi:hypothetical protein
MVRLINQKSTLIRRLNMSWRNWRKSLETKKQKAPAFIKALLKGCRVEKVHQERNWIVIKPKSMLKLVKRRKSFHPLYYVHVPMGIMSPDPVVYFLIKYKGWEIKAEGNLEDEPFISVNPIVEELMDIGKQTKDKDLIMF